MAIYTDGSKIGEIAAWAAVNSAMTVARNLLDFTVFTVELVAICLALEILNKSCQQSFLMCSDSLSFLPVDHNSKLEHPLVVDIFGKQQTTQQ